MAFRDNLAKLRSLAAEKGYKIERGVVRDTWILTHEKTGKHAVSSSGKTAFSVAKAISLFSSRCQSALGALLVRNATLHGVMVRRLVVVGGTIG